MKFSTKLARRSLVAMAALSAAAAWLPASAQDCTITGGKGDVNVTGNVAPSMLHMAKEMEKCSKGGVKVTVKVTPEARLETERAFAAEGKSPIDAAVVSGGVYSGLMSKGQLQPLTDLVAKHKAKYKIEDNMLVKSNGEVMAIALDRKSVV